MMWVIQLDKFYLINILRTTITFTTLKLKNLTRKQRVVFMLIQKFENEVHCQKLISNSRRKTYTNQFT